MTSPGGAHVADVHVDVHPDASGFEADLRRQIRAVAVAVRTNPDTTGFAAALRAQLRKLPDLKVLVAPDTSTFRAKLRAELARLTPVNVKVAAAPNLAGFNARLRTDLAALPAVSHNVRVTPSVAGFNRDLRTALAALGKVDVKVNVVPSVVGFNAALRAALAALPQVRHNVGLEPSTTGFAARLRAALAALPTGSVRITLTMPTATAAGARIGGEAARVFVAAFNAAMAGARWGTPGPGAGASGIAGGQAGGAYAATFRRVVAEALRNLPEPTIGVASGPAEQAIRDIRNSLERLGNERVGITIDAGQARAEADRIRVDLARLQAMSPIDVDVEANARAAQLVLDRLEGQLAAIGRERTATVRVRTDHNQLAGLQTALLGSTSRMQLLITAGLALGPAIVPAAAAAAAAIAAIGGAAISAGAGLGVGILALSGVVGAVKALNDARGEQTKLNNSIIRGDRQIAGSTDQVASAVASLANTRAQAASQARQSAQSIADSERGLADAQRDYLRVQQDLNRARQEAADALEDLDSAVKNNSLSIRQANLDLADAERELRKVQNLPVDNRARIETQLAYDRAKQSLDDLTLRHGRLTEEQQRSSKAGVEGSDQVRAAHDRIGDAQRRVQDAERGVADARTQAAEQARQSAHSITQAQQAVANAQRTAAAANLATATTANAALETLRQKMAALSPEAQRFSRFVVDLQPHLVGLRQSAEQALPGFQRGIQALLPALPALNDFIRRTAVALGEIGQATGEAFNGAKLRPFFGYIDSTAIPTMRQLADATGNVAVGFANMVVGFGPAQRQLTGGLVELTEKFETWSTTLDRNNGFQRFIDYAITRGPIVMRTINDIGGALVHILEAAAPAGDVVLTVLSGLAHVINAIPIPVLTALLTTMTALRVAALLSAIPVGALATNIRSVATGAVGMRAAMGGAVAFLGGPWTLAIAAATIGIGLLVARSASQRAEIDRLVTSLDQYGDALKEGMTRETLANAQAILRQDAALRGLVNAVDTAGLSQQTLVAGLNGDRNARNAVIAALNVQIESEKALQREARGSSDSETVASLAHKRRAEELERLRIAFAKTSGANAEAAELAARLAAEERNLVDAITAVRTALSETGGTAQTFGNAISLVGDLSVDAAAKTGAFALIADKVAASTLDGADKAKLFGRILGEIGSAAGSQGATFDALAGTFSNIASSSLDATTKVGLLRQAMQQMYGAAIDQYEADLQLVAAKQNLTTQVATNSAGFDINTAKKGQNTQAILANIEALKTALLRAREKYLQDIANGESEEAARAAHVATTKAILEGLGPTAAASKAVQDLNARYGQIPPVKTTQVTSPGLDKAINDLIDAHAIQVGLAQRPPWSKDTIASEARNLRNAMMGQKNSTAAYKAEGGIIPGTSPSKKADDKLFWLTSGEFVQPVDTVDYYGVGMMEALRKRQIPKWALQGYATGGFVGQRHFGGTLSQFPVTVEPTIVPYPDVAAMWRQYEAAKAAYSTGGDPGNVGPGPGFTPWPSSPGASRGDSGVWKSVLALIRSTGPVSGSFGNAYRHGDPLWHGCVPMDTLIYTRRGWIRYEDVRIGEDETVGYNPDTGRSEWTLIVGMHHYDDAELWTIGADGWQAEVTPGHKWLTNHGLVETRNLTAYTTVRLTTPLADGVVGEDLVDGDRRVTAVHRTAVRKAEVFCPTTTLRTWTAKQGRRVFLTGNSGRAIDWMGYNQDALAQFFMARQGQLLEFIHRTNTADYGVTRGRRSNFPTQFPLHRNHIHVAMSDGGYVQVPHLFRDYGGMVPPGLSLVDNRTGRDEWMFNDGQIKELVGARAGGDKASRDVHIYPQRATFDLNDLRAEMARQEALDRTGLPY